MMAVSQIFADHIRAWRRSGHFDNRFDLVPTRPIAISMQKVAEISVEEDDCRAYVDVSHQWADSCVRSY